MKRILSLALCVLMFVTMFTATAGQVYALGNASELFTVKNSGFEDNLITYTISFAPGTKRLFGAIVEVHFNSDALRVKKAGAAGTENSAGDFIKNVSGVYQTGHKHDVDGVYVIAYMHGTGYNVGSSAKDFATITFEAVSSERTVETVEFKCVEFATDDGNNENDIKKNESVQTISSHTFHTLAMPKGTSVASYDKGLKVVWSEVEGAQKYELRRRLADDTEWTTVDGNVTNNEYVDNSVVQGKEYYYSVVALNEYGPSNYDKTGIPGMFFGSIESISADIIATGAVITWSELPGAKEYKVCRKSAASTAWQTVATVTEAKYEDTSLESGQEYSYKVNAIDKTGKYRADMLCSPPKVKFIAAPDASVWNISDGIEISFDEVGGVQKYVVEKKIADGSYSVLTEITEISDGAYVDENVVVGEKYTYRVYAVASDKTKSKKITVGPIVRIGTPVISEVKNTSEGVSLKWNAVSGATGYEVLRKDGDESVFSSYMTTTPNYIDTTVVSGVKYTYTICAHNDSGYGAYLEPGVDIKHLSVPKISSVSAVEDTIEIKWGKVSGAKSYKIYRKDNVNKNWQLIGTSETPGFSDTNFEEGVFYKYTVKAIADGYESAYNTKGVEGMCFGSVSWIKAKTVTKGAKITWEALSKAESYEVYRKADGDKKYTLIATVTTAEYTDTAMTSGVAYTYMVKAYSGGKVSEMTATPVSAKFLKTPEAVAKNVVNGIQITVTPVGGATGYVIEKDVNGKYEKLVTLGAKQTKYIDTGVVAETKYSYRVYATSSDLKSGVYKVGTILRPACPKITKISGTVDALSITWKPISNAKYYQVLSKDEGADDWTVIKDKVTATTYTDVFVTGGKKYTYTINAVMKDGGQSGYNQKGVTYKFLETPELVSVTNVNGGMKFTWSAVKGATAYKVYRKTSGTGWAVINANCKGTSFVDKTCTSGKKWTYTVKALDGECESYLGSGISEVYLATPTPKISQTSGGIKVSWNKIEGATLYRVYRKVGSGSWAKVTDVKSSVTSYVDKDSNKYSGKKCAYTVKAYYSTTKTWSASKSSATLLSLATPTVTVSNVDKGITVKWSKVAGATSYMIYRKTGNGSWAKVKEVTSSSTSYTDTSVNKAGGKTYYYAVKAYHSGTKTMGAYKSSVAIVRLMTPTLKSAASSKTGITLKWDKVTGASGYMVYRKTTGGWQKIATIEGNSKISYLDKDAKKGVTYKYTVKAYNGSSVSACNTNGIACKDRY